MHHICTILGTDIELGQQLYQQLLLYYGVQYLSCISATRLSHKYLQYLKVKVLILHPYDYAVLEPHLLLIERLMIHCFIVGKHNLLSKYVHSISCVSDLIHYSSLLPFLTNTGWQTSSVHNWYLSSVLYLQVHEQKTMVCFPNFTTVVFHATSNFRVRIKQKHICMEEYLICCDSIQALELHHLRLQTGEHLSFSGQVPQLFHHICHSLLPGLCIKASADQYQILLPADFPVL